MKKVIVMSFFLSFSAICMAQNGFVDLGLPSGTLWNNRNENGYYDYYYAASRFGTNSEANSDWDVRGTLPSERQFRELRNECEWNWNGYGYRIVGPNGNSIFLPAKGYQHERSGTVEDDGEICYYWISNPNAGLYSLECWRVGAGGVNPHSIGNGYYLSVRLVIE